MQKSQLPQNKPYFQRVVNLLISEYPDIAATLKNAIATGDYPVISEAIQNTILFTEADYAQLSGEDRKFADNHKHEQNVKALTMLLEETDHKHNYYTLVLSTFDDAGKGALGPLMLKAEQGDNQAKQDIIDIVDGKLQYQEAMMTPSAPESHTDRLKGRDSSGSQPGLGGRS